MPLILVTLYLLACLVCGIMGRNTTIGFIGHFLLAFFLTPPVNFLVQAVGRPSAREREKTLTTGPR
ncbi:hypothetical protein [Azospirillum isscasi]|uniref:Uncharacterized protein n=1 Tax=Azospirillum isscasi TaxID=3053926 RepID=A0ABU0WDM2_9PROT|nr:hypothetical protein [Azospirillum isscasi]MDQ2102297.1 hypothetical protein [Azospirillum isscasi]